MMTAMRVACGSLLCLVVACVAAPLPERAAQTEMPGVSCEKGSDADFEGDGEERFLSYLDWIVRAHGVQAGLMPYHVTLAIVRGAPKPGPGGITAGDISCDARRYRITLYRDALAGRPLQVAYRTLAHEFFHVVQVRRDGLACEAPGDERAAYEDEAVAFAARVVPACQFRTASAAARNAERTGGGCEVVRRADFEGAAAGAWQSYVDGLVRTRGADFGLMPGDVALAIADGAPRPGLRGVIAADIGCSTGAVPYRITLYRRALEGRRLSVAHHTLVRQFQHIVQMRRDGLACEGGDAQLAPHYEREALEVADWLVPACK